MPDTKAHKVHKAPGATHRFNVTSFPSRRLIRLVEVNRRNVTTDDWWVVSNMFIFAIFFSAQLEETIQFLVVTTLPETNSSPLKMDGWETSFLLGRPIYRVIPGSK